MKYLKQKLMAAVAMLMVSATMLSSVSYAWFTLSTNPEITGMKFDVAANENLEIRLDGTATKTAPITNGDNYTYGSLVTLKDIGSDTTTTALQPVRYGSGKISTTTYGTDGRISAITEVADANIVEDTTTEGIFYYKDGAGTIVAVRVDFYLRTNTDSCSVSLCEAVERAKGEGNTGLGSTLAASAYGNGIAIDFYLPQGLSGEANAAGVNVPVTITKSENNCKLEATLGTITKNKDIPVQMFVYIDGDSTETGNSNSNTTAFLTNITDIALNVQFAGSTVDSPINGYTASSGS